MGYKISIIHCIFGFHLVPVLTVISLNELSGVSTSVIENIQNNWLNARIQNDTHEHSEYTLSGMKATIIKCPLWNTLKNVQMFWHSYRNCTFLLEKHSLKSFIYLIYFVWIFLKWLLARILPLCFCFFFSFSFILCVCAK